MNRGVLQSSPVQQIMAAGNPNWFPITATRPPSHHLPNSPYSHPLPTHHNNFNYLPPQTHHSSFPFSSPSWTLNDSTTNQDHITQDSWSHQLLMNGLVGDEEREAMEQLVKQENNTNCGFMYANNEDFQQGKPTNNHCFSPHSNKFIAPTSTNSSSTTATTTSSPQSCITNLFEFSSSPAPAKPDLQLPVPAIPDPSSEGGAVKKAKVQTSATQSTFKVRKFGDRITSLHQLVSPFGKTDTASVLLEAIGYIRFLHSQIEALSIPYLSNGSGNNKRQQHHPHSAQGERNCIFPEDGGQLLNDNCLKRKRGPDQEEALRDLRSIGLCLVPVSCISNVGRETGADYWAPALGGFR